MNVIYKATNIINDKSYIGFDSSWPRRKRRHIWSSFAPKHDEYFYSFHRAIREYGQDSFVWEILYESKDSDFMLNIMESYFIHLYDTHYIAGNGYNMTYGGEGTLGGRWNLSTVTRNKQSNSWTLDRRMEQSVRLHGVKKPNGHGAAVAEARSLNWQLVSPDGKELLVCNLKKFCREYGLSASTMVQVSKGKWVRHKGWQCKRLLTSG